MLLQLLKLYNMFFTTGIFPESWKNYYIVLIPKSAKDSYGPIALPSSFLKMAEKLIKPKIEWCFETNRILPRSQYGFRRGRGYLDSLEILASDANLNTTLNGYMTAAFLDVKGAYDNVS